MDARNVFDIGRCREVKRCLSIAPCLLLLACSALATSGRSWGESPIALDVESKLRDVIGYLADDKLKGRSVADDSIDLAADFVAEQMNDIGLKTDLFDGKPFQSVDIQLAAQAGSAQNNRVIFSLPKPEDELAADTLDGDQSLEDAASSNRVPLVASLGIEMNPMTVGSLEGNIDAPVAFVGYGITAPENSYDDYQGIDIGGHIAIILRKEPQAQQPNSRFDGTRNTRHATFINKIRNAIENGAVAIALVNDADSTQRTVNRQQSRIDGELVRRRKMVEQRDALPSEAVNNRKTISERINSVDSIVESMKLEMDGIAKGLMGISDAGNPPDNIRSVPVVTLSRDFASKLISRSSGRTLAEIESAIDQALIPQSFVLERAKANLRSEVRPTKRASNNVIGVLPGRGSLANETVIVGAHYDHVGMGGIGSLAPGTIAVHNGADDNASGTATMLATARLLTNRLKNRRDHRRIVFIAFTGEERGLLGSKHYVKQPRFALESTVAMVNLDMVGRLRDNDLTVYGTGSGTQLNEIVDQANEKLGRSGRDFQIFKVASGYGPSDHQSFYLARIPVLFFFTGLHNDYHRPSDDFDKIDFGAMTRITDIVSESTFQLATLSQRPQYTETESKVEIRWQKTAFLGVSLSDRGEQVAISSLVSGGPAERAGVQLGDQILRMGNRKVKTASDVLAAMRGRRPGEEMKLRLIRNGQIIDQLVKLGERP